VNVWVALAHDRHAHHVPARTWLNGIEETVFFCRFTQLGFLRLLDCALQSMAGLSLVLLSGV
jgi:predicted nucleic acid-binding protein